MPAETGPFEARRTASCASSTLMPPPSGVFSQQAWPRGWSVGGGAAPGEGGCAGFGQVDALGLRGHIKQRHNLPGQATSEHDCALAATGAPLCETRHAITRIITTGPALVVHATMQHRCLHSPHNDGRSRCCKEYPARRLWNSDVNVPAQMGRTSGARIGTSALLSPQAYKRCSRTSAPPSPQTDKRAARISFSS